MLAHKGIVGNEMAGIDKNAKSSLNNNLVRVRRPVEDRLLILEDEKKVIFQQRLISTVNERNIGRFGFSIENKIECWKHAFQKSRRLETVLARFRSGHGGVASRLFRFGIVNRPLCKCGDIEDVEHFLLQCPIYNQQRNKLIYNINQLKLNQRLDIKLLLGVSKNSENIQNIIIFYIYICFPQKE